MKEQETRHVNKKIFKKKKQCSDRVTDYIVKLTRSTFTSIDDINMVQNVAPFLPTT